MFKFVRQLLKVLWSVLKESREHKALIERVEKAGRKRMSVTQDQAYKVRRGDNFDYNVQYEQAHRDAADTAFIPFSNSCHP